MIRLRYAALSVAIVAVGAGVPAAIATGTVKVGYAWASRPDALGLQRAEKAGIASFVVSKHDFPSVDLFSEQIFARCREASRH